MRHPIDQEFAVVVASLLAGRIDGQQAIASLVAIDTAHLAAILADPETVEAVWSALDAINVRGWYMAPDRQTGEAMQQEAAPEEIARAAIAVIAARIGL